MAVLYLVNGGQHPQELPSAAEETSQG
jgi:hypothetical protein